MAYVCFPDKASDCTPKNQVDPNQYQNQTIEFIGPARQLFNSIDEQAEFYLSNFCPNWKNYDNPESYIIPPTFSYQKQFVSDQDLERYEKTQIKISGLSASRAGEKAEHVMYDAICNVIQENIKPPFIAVHNFKLDLRKVKLMKRIFKCETAKNNAVCLCHSTAPQNRWEKFYQDLKQIDKSRKDIQLEYDFLIIGAQIGFILIEVKSSKFNGKSDFINGSKGLPNEYDHAIKQQLMSIRPFLDMIGDCIGMESPSKDNVHKIVFTPNLKAERYAVWISTLPFEYKPFTEIGTLQLFEEDAEYDSIERFTSFIKCLNRGPEFRLVYEMYAKAIVGIQAMMEFHLSPGEAATCPVDQINEELVSLTLTEGATGQDPSVLDYVQPVDQKTEENDRAKGKTRKRKQEQSDLKQNKKTNTSTVTILELSEKTFSPTLAVSKTFDLIDQKLAITDLNKDYDNASKLIRSSKIAKGLPVVFLTPEQQQILNDQSNYQVIMGFAGTGKSMLIKHKALELLNAGEPVIIVATKAFKTKYESDFNEHLPVDKRNFEIYTWSGLVDKVLVSEQLGSESLDCLYSAKAFYEEMRATKWTHIEKEKFHHYVTHEINDGLLCRIIKTNTDSEEVVSSKTTRGTLREAVWRKLWEDDYKDMYDAVEGAYVCTQTQKYLCDQMQNYYQTLQENVQRLLSQYHMLIDDALCDLTEYEPGMFLLCAMSALKASSQQTTNLVDRRDHTLLIAYDMWQYIDITCQSDENNALIDLLYSTLSFSSSCSFTSLNRVMHFSVEIFNSAYTSIGIQQNDKTFYGASPPVMGHRIQGLKPVASAKVFFTLTAAYCSMQEDLSGIIARLMNTRNQNSIGIVVYGDCPDYTVADIVEYLTFACPNTTVVAIEEYSKNSTGVIVGTWREVASFEWPILIGIGFRKTDGKFQGIQEYFVDTRAIAFLIKLVYFYDTDEILNVKGEEGQKLKLQLKGENLVYLEESPELGFEKKMVYSFAVEAWEAMREQLRKLMMELLTTTACPSIAGIILDGECAGYTKDLVEHFKSQLPADLQISEMNDNEENADMTPPNICISNFYEITSEPNWPLIIYVCM